MTVMQGNTNYDFVEKNLLDLMVVEYVYVYCIDRNMCFVWKNSRLAARWLLAKVHCHFKNIIPQVA